MLLLMLPVQYFEFRLSDLLIELMMGQVCCSYSVASFVFLSIVLLFFYML